MWIAVVLATAAGELLPDSSPPLKLVGGINDKVLHFGAYALIAFLAAVLFRRSLALLCAGAAALLGVVLEFVQILVHRDFEIGDMVANTLGVLAGLGFAALIGAVKTRSAPGAPSLWRSLIYVVLCAGTAGGTFVYLGAAGPRSYLACIVVFGAAAVVFAPVADS